MVSELPGPPGPRCCPTGTLFFMIWKREKVWMWFFQSYWQSWDKYAAALIEEVLHHWHGWLLVVLLLRLKHKETMGCSWKKGVRAWTCHIRHPSAYCNGTYIASYIQETSPGVCPWGPQPLHFLTIPGSREELNPWMTAVDCNQTSNQFITGMKVSTCHFECLQYWAGPYKALTFHFVGLPISLFKSRLTWGIWVSGYQIVLTSVSTSRKSLPLPLSLSDGASELFLVEPEE